MTSGKFASDSPALPLGLVNKSLPEQVADHLAETIQEGKFKPGDRLKEEALAEHFAVSRTTIREAIGALERRGLVERIPRYGTRVRIIDASEIEEIFRIRAQLLGLAAHIVAESGSSEVLEHINQRANRLIELAAKPETTPAVYGKASIELQQFLVAEAGGKQLPALYESLGNQALWRSSVRGKSLSFLTPQRRQESAADWRRVADAIAARKPDEAEKYAKALLHASYRAVKEQL